MPSLKSFGAVAAVGASSLLYTPPQADAATITVQMDATVTSSAVPSVPVNTPATVRFTINDSTPDTFVSNPDLGAFIDAANIQVSMLGRSTLGSGMDVYVSNFVPAAEIPDTLSFNSAASIGDSFPLFNVTSLDGLLSGADDFPGGGLVVTNDTLPPAVAALYSGVNRFSNPANFLNMGTTQGNITLSVDGNSGQIAVIPEPSAVAALAVISAGMLSRRRRPIDAAPSAPTAEAA